MKILIVKNKRIGDVLVASIVANNLKKIYPQAHITFLCYDYAAPVLLHNPNIDYIWTINDKKLKKGLSIFKLSSEIKKQHYDLIVDLYVKLQSQLISLLSGANRRIAFEKKALPFAYTDRVPFLKTKISNYGKAIDDRLNVLRYLNSEIEYDAQPKIYLTKNEIFIAKNILTYHGFDFSKKSLMLGVLGSNPSKSLPLDTIAKIIDYITANYDLQILFNYIPNQKPLVDLLLKKIKNNSKIFTEILGKDIREFSIIMSQIDFLIANEGGAVHIAKALNKPTFTIYSPYVNKEHWATFEDGKHNQSIHLKDVRPELFESLNSKTIKKETKNLYSQFSAEAILSKMNSFLAQFF
ncbi:heptosyltransferase-2 [Leeuwenhoekiella aestuarii]|uniref:glycosyltransferase family 9 protein n=1 Tax=Leeuwenhoekiella aestuarii TaxID=2249426 RepID=UPI001024CA8A|nr:glycosyltransferase family 9 protein [Leeuwenhoekiella aestuarii]RXG16140.1 heptosyltransferase-2 [Leeuwenhoekiella aestuarii]